MSSQPLAGTSYKLRPPSVSRIAVIDPVLGVSNDSSIDSSVDSASDACNLGVSVVTLVGREARLALGEARGGVV